MSNASIISALIAFAITAVSGPVIIPFLKRLKCGQTVREDGPCTHHKKNGTPTMGGVLILFSVVVTSLFFVEEYPKIVPILFLTFGFGLIGLLDDFIKVVGKTSEGLKPWQKMLGQMVVTGIFAYYLLHFTELDLVMSIPYITGRYIDLGIWTIPFLFFLVIGTANGVNFTDGLDGLAGSVTVIVAIFFSVVAIGTNSGVEPVTCAVAGALLGFLLFNVHPASVFMGDTGSLALGGFVASCGYVLEIPLFIAIVGIVYLAEVLSVILQVAYFKLSGGKRIFKMAPLHHHFELCGFTETKIVTMFTIVTAFMCLIGLKGI